MDSEAEKKLGRNPQWVADKLGGKKEKSATRDAWRSRQWLQKHRGEQQQRAWGTFRLLAESLGAEACQSPFLDEACSSRWWEEQVWRWKYMRNS